MNQIIRIARDLLDDKQAFVIAKVVDTHGSTPRSIGAWLLMKQDGESFGTVGGGSLEAAVQKICRETFTTKENQIFHFHLNEADQMNLDMRCGGDADVSIEYYSGESVEEYKDTFTVLPKAYIFGGGHVGKAIEPLLRYVDFSTIVLDDRFEFANAERFPDAAQVIVIEAYEKAFEQIEIDENSYIIIVTRGHRGDYAVLRDAIEKNPAYIGMIGSKKKVFAMFDRLREEGVSQEVIDKIYSPIGLKIKAETPEEIAVSVVAEMISVRAEHGK